jgi:hypothetical protein
MQMKLLEVSNHADAPAAVIGRSALHGPIAAREPARRPASFKQDGHGARGSGRAPPDSRAG